MSSNHFKKTILMVFSTVPYPLRANGVSIRYIPVIQHLSQHHTIDIIIIHKNNINPGIIEALKAYCRRVFVIRNSKSANHPPASQYITKAWLMLPWTPPISWVTYGGKRITRQVAEVTKGIYYDSLVCVGGPNFLHLQSVCAGRVVVDFIDSPSLSTERKVIGYLNFILLEKYDCWKTKRWEAKVIRNSTTSIYVSPVDAQNLPAESTLGCKRHVIPNGIFADGYTSSAEKGVQSPNIGFLGNMAYPPNIEAVHWLYEQVFLPLRSKLSNLSLYIIGRDPVATVFDLGKKKGVTVTGSVDNIWPYVNAVDVFVFPLCRGAGLKNKVLEAMYAKRPVVTTQIGNEGIGALPGRDLLVCDGAIDFQYEVLRLLNSRDEMTIVGESGHRFVSQNFSWDRILKDFDKVITGCNETPS